MQYQTNLQRNLINITREKGINQTYISKQLHIAPTTVNAWFRGANQPRYKTLEKLAKILGVTVPDLMSNNFYYNSTIVEKNTETPNKSNTETKPVSVLPKADEGGDTLLGKSKEFWQIMQIVDDMPVNKQKEVLAVISAISRH